MGLHIRVVLHTLALLLLISIANVVLLVALVIKPFNEKLSWDLACMTAQAKRVIMTSAFRMSHTSPAEAKRSDWFWSYMQEHWENSLNAREALEVSGDKLPKGESAIVISNHLSYGDYYLVQALASRAGMLGSCRYFVKKEIVWQIPIFGWAFWAIGMILVSRNWTNDSRLIEQAFGRVKENGHDVWIVLYPEGTRRTDRKVLESKAFARQHEKPELDRLLLPRSKGFQATLKGLRDSQVKHVYDLTFQYASPGRKFERVPSLSEQLAVADLAKAGYRFRIHVKRLPIADMPTDDEGVKTWLENLWTEKDRLLAVWAEDRKRRFEQVEKAAEEQRTQRQSARRDSVPLTVHSRMPEEDPAQRMEVAAGRSKAD